MIETFNGNARAANAHRYSAHEFSLSVGFVLSISVEKKYYVRFCNVSLERLCDLEEIKIQIQYLYRTFVKFDKRDPSKFLGRVLA